MSVDILQMVTLIGADRSVGDPCAPAMMCQIVPGRSVGNTRQAVMSRMIGSDASGLTGRTCVVRPVLTQEVATLTLSGVMTGMQSTGQIVSPTSTHVTCVSRRKASL